MLPLDMDNERYVNSTRPPGSPSVTATYVGVQGVRGNSNRPSGDAYVAPTNAYGGTQQGGNGDGDGGAWRDARRVGEGEGVGVGAVAPCQTA